MSCGLNFWRNLPVLLLPPLPFPMTLCEAWGVKTWLSGAGKERRKEQGGGEAGTGKGVGSGRGAAGRHGSREVFSPVFPLAPGLCGVLTQSCVVTLGRFVLWWALGRKSKDMGLAHTSQPVTCALEQVSLFSEPWLSQMFRSECLTGCEAAWAKVLCEKLNNYVLRQFTTIHLPLFLFNSFFDI